MGELDLRDAYNEGKKAVRCRIGLFIFFLNVARISSIKRPRRFIDEMRTGSGREIVIGFRICDSKLPPPEIGRAEGIPAMGYFQVPISVVIIADGW